MTPAMAELINRHRRTIAEMQRDMEAFQERDMAIYSNGADVTADHMAEMQKRIEKLETLVERYDPEGFTTLV